MESGDQRLAMGSGEVEGDGVEGGGEDGGVACAGDVADGERGIGAVADGVAVTGEGAGPVVPPDDGLAVPDRAGLPGIPC